MDSLGEDSIYGDAELKTVRDRFTFRSGSTTIGNEKYATIFVMSELCDELHGSDREDKEASRMDKFCIWIGCDKDVEDMFPVFQDISYNKSA